MIAGPEVVKWVCEGIQLDDPGPAVAIGIGEPLIAGVLYNNYRHDCIEMSVYSTDSRWCNRKTLGILFEYPFEQLKVRRIQATIARKNKVARNFVERLGFVYEGMARQAHHLGGDAAVYSMLRKECKWVNRHQKPQIQ